MRYLGIAVSWLGCVAGTLQVSSCSPRCEHTTALDEGTFDSATADITAECAGPRCDFSRVSAVAFGLTSQPCFERDSIDATINGVAASAAGGNVGRTVDVLRGQSECHCRVLVVDHPSAPVSLIGGLTLNVDRKVDIVFPSTLLPQEMALSVPEDATVAADDTFELTWLPSDLPPPTARISVKGTVIPLEVLEEQPGRHVVRIPTFALGLPPGTYEIGADWKTSQSGTCNDELACRVLSTTSMDVDVTVQ